MEVQLYNLLDGQEVFEKIIEKLQECERQAEKDMGLSEKYAEANAYGGEMIAFEKAIEIVKQEAAECNNGWIPVSERLPKEPEKGGDIEEDICSEKLVEYIVMIYGAKKPTTLYYAGNGHWYDEVSRECCPVIAWQPLPEPYQEGE